MAYTKVWPEGWKDNEEGGTYINAAGLNKMEQGIVDAHEFMARTDNPHKVTKTQVGLGNVPDVTTNNQTPTYTAASTLTALASGEKLSVVFSKLAKAVTDLISHLADNVRHITADERTAWNAKTETAVKGDKEALYRTGNVNLTPADIGAADATNQANIDAAQNTRIADLESENALLRELVNGIDAPVYRTVGPGNPVTFSDGYAANVKALSVDITPTQSGEGDPYPPGGGKNLLDLRNARSGTGEGVTYTRLDDGAYSRVGTATGVAGNIWFRGGYKDTVTIFTLRAGHTYFVHDCSLFYDGHTVAHNIQTITPESDLPVGGVRNPIQTTGTVYNDIIHPMIIDLTDFPDTDISGDTWYPYANIRPIAGASSVSVTRTGKNLFAPTDNGYTDTYGGIRSSNANPSLWLPVSPGQSYTLSAQQTVSSIGVTFYDAQKVFIPSSRTGVQNTDILTVTAPDSAALSYWWVNPKGNNDTTPVPSIMNDTDTDYLVQLERGTVRTAYAPRPQSVTVSLVDSSGDPLTVYGGTLNVTTGELTVTHRGLEVDETAAWTWYVNSNSALLSNALPGRKGLGDSVQLYGLCNMQPSRNGVIQSATATAKTSADLQCFQIGTNWGVQDVSLDGWKAFLAKYPLRIIYELETPLTYQLTPTQISTLYGYNAISTDAETVTVTYRADTALSLGGG